MSKSILIVEDEDIIRETLTEFLSGEGFDVASAANAADALKLVREKDFDVGICDVQLPDGDGVQLMRRLHRLNPGMFVLIISAYATVENAVGAFTAGAFDYLVKPVIFDELVNRLKRLFQFQDLYLENQRLRKDLDGRGGIEEIMGRSRVLQDTLNTSRKVADINSNVLMVGETGTGK
ncbi:MAG: sigma-54-dependent Fis family transcriptional regulator, partial [Fuerstiella sp.]|nr:sigma-54-dependent Fis family transcriptional regulator [Fuerstiella sp.]